MVKICISLIAALICFVSFSNHKVSIPDVEVVSSGSVPQIAKDNHNILHLVFGKGDSILYAFSRDGGTSFCDPELVDTVPQLFSFAMRGPQISATEAGVCIVAATQQGNILSYQKKGSEKWKKTNRVNDLDTVAKEGMLALGTNGKQGLFAVWLDLRKGQNNVYGAQSVDGGSHWSKNKMIYTSPDGHVCECCKPSIAVRGNQVAVMFRNWLGGNRNLYVTESFDGGKTFQRAKKMGFGSWKLDGCPMDGGGLVITPRGIVETVWRRGNSIFAAQAGVAEEEVGVGRSCTLEIIGDKIVYAWVEKGEIIIRKADGSKVGLGKGQLPVLRAINKDQVVCVWENEHQILKAVVSI